MIYQTRHRRSADNENAERSQECSAFAKEGKLKAKRRLRRGFRVHDLQQYDLS